jgi:hypothetical protein
MKVSEQLDKIFMAQVEKDRVITEITSDLSNALLRVHQLEADFYQALQRENALQITLFEAGLEIVHPWHHNEEE